MRAGAVWEEDRPKTTIAITIHSTDKPRTIHLSKLESVICAWATDTAGGTENLTSLEEDWAVTVVGSDVAGSGEAEAGSITAELVCDLTATTGVEATAGCSAGDTGCLLGIATGVFGATDCVFA